uniref:Uncharacterized protein n=1 Tax=Coturnix japonica TaxID=93934 RepID=A0A8C2SP82_COTJA
MGLYRGILGFMDMGYGIWGYGIWGIWGDMGLYGVYWGDMGVNGDIWVYGDIWGILGNIGLYVLVHPNIGQNDPQQFVLYGFKIHPMAYQLQLQAASNFKSPVKTIR